MANAGPNTNGSQVRPAPLFFPFESHNHPTLTFLYPLSIQSSSSPRSSLFSRLTQSHKSPLLTPPLFSRSYVCSGPTPHLNGKHVVFGEVVGGEDTFKAIEAQGSQGGQTRQPMSIEAAGEIDA